MMRIMKAYGLLWRDMSGSKFAQEARAELLALLEPDERREAIAWVQKTYPITENEIAHQ